MPVVVKTAPYDSFSDKHVTWYLKGGEATQAELILNLALPRLAQ